MAWANWQVQGAMTGIKEVGSFILKSRQAKSDRAWQKYNNAMTRIQNATNQNALTANEGMLVERTVRERFNTDLSAYKTKASGVVAAAAVGAEGNSVERVLAEVEHNRARAQSGITTDLNYQQQGIAQQRASSNMQTEMQIDYTQIPKPNFASSLLDWGANTTMKWWESKKI